MNRRGRDYEPRWAPTALPATPVSLVLSRKREPELNRRGRDYEPRWAPTALPATRVSSRLPLHAVHEREPMIGTRAPAARGDPRGHQATTRRCASRGLAVERDARVLGTRRTETVTRTGLSPVTVPIQQRRGVSPQRDTVTRRSARGGSDTARRVTRAGWRQESAQHGRRMPDIGIRADIRDMVDATVIEIAYIVERFIMASGRFSPGAASSQRRQHSCL